MFRTKTIIKLRKDGVYWKIRIGNTTYLPRMGISRLFRFLAKLIQDKGKVYSIDIIIKRKR